MENNNLENMTYYQLEERLMDIIHNINRLDYNEFKYHLRLRTLFNDDKVKLYNKLKSEIDDIDDLIRIIKGFDRIEETKEELKEILKNINLKDYNFIMDMDRFKKPKLINDRELLYNNFIKKYHFCEYYEFVQKYNHRELYNNYE